MQQEHLRIGCLAELHSILDKERPQRIFLVRGKESYASSGAEEKMSSVLQGHKVVSFSDFSANVKIEDVEKGRMVFQRNNCDLTLAIGGGSAIDVAKAITFLANAPGPAADYISSSRIFSHNKIPLVAIPTTSGTG